jgi:hypothetical protein
MQAGGAFLFAGLIIGTLELVTRLVADTWWQVILFALAVVLVWGPVLLAVGCLLKKAFRLRCRSCRQRTLEYDPRQLMMIVDPPPPDWFETEFWHCHNCGAWAERVRGVWRSHGGGTTPNQPLQQAGQAIDVHSGSAYHPA